MDYCELTIDVVAATRNGGGMHGCLDLNDEPFCVRFNSVVLPTPNARTARLDLVTCQQCLEWIHA